MRLNKYTFGYEISMSELLSRLAQLAKIVPIQAIEIDPNDVTIFIEPKHTRLFDNEKHLLNIKEVHQKLAPTIKTITGE